MLKGCGIQLTVGDRTAGWLVTFHLGGQSPLLACWSAVLRWCACVCVCARMHELCVCECVCGVCECGCFCVYRMDLKCALLWHIHIFIRYYATIHTQTCSLILFEDRELRGLAMDIALQ